MVPGSKPATSCVSLGNPGSPRPPEDRARVPPGEEDREERHDRQHDEGDEQEDQHDEVRDREESLDEPQPAAELRIECSLDSNRVW
jgi:hypothetical protein